MKFYITQEVEETEDSINYTDNYKVSKKPEGYSDLVSYETTEEEEN